MHRTIFGAPLSLLRTKWVSLNALDSTESQILCDRATNDKWWNTQHINKTHMRHNLHCCNFWHFIQISFELYIVQSRQNAHEIHSLLFSSSFFINFSFIFKWIGIQSMRCIFMCTHRFIRQRLLWRVKMRNIRSGLLNASMHLLSM